MQSVTFLEAMRLPQVILAEFERLPSHEGWVRASIQSITDFDDGTGSEIEFDAVDQEMTVEGMFARVEAVARAANIAAVCIQQLA